MKTKRCLLTIFALFVSALSVSVLILQKGANENGQFLKELPAHRVQAIWEKSKEDFNTIRNRLQRRKLLKSIFDKTRNTDVAQQWPEEDAREFGSVSDSNDQGFFAGEDNHQKFVSDSDFIRDDQLTSRSHSKGYANDHFDRTASRDVATRRGFSERSKDVRLNRAMAGDSNLPMAALVGDSNQSVARKFRQPLGNPGYFLAGNSNFQRFERLPARLYGQYPSLDSNSLDRASITYPTAVGLRSSTVLPQARRSEPTIVTAIFDIGRGNWTQYTRPYSMYQDYMKRLLGLDINLVVFADSEGAAFVRRHRKKRMHKTMIQEMSVQQLPFYVQHYQRIKDLIDKEQANWKPEWDSSMRYHPESISPEYDILMNSKPYFVYYVANWNPFHAEYFYWLDAGYGHGKSIYPSEGSYWAPENLMKSGVGEKITFIQLGPGDIKILKLKDIYRQGLTVVNGGFFGGNKRALGEYYNLHNRIFEDLLNRGYVDDDQTLTVLCYQENPQLFNMVVGDWYDVFRLFRLTTTASR